MGSMCTRAMYVAIIIGVSGSQALASCVKPPASIEAIAHFKSHPEALVAPTETSRVVEITARDLAGTEADLAADLVRIAASAPPLLQTAIAAGLAQAALACSSVDQNAAQQIQQAVAGFANGSFQAAFAAVAGDLSTAAVAAAASEAASSFGSVVIINPNRSTNRAGPLGGGGSAHSIIFDIAAPSVLTGQTFDGGTTAAEPVSATR
jgi:hypothetical protein